jgi:dipeptidase
MNIILILVITAIVLTFKARPAAACFTIVAGKKVSATGRVLVGHNEDDGERAVFRYAYVPAAKWPANAYIPVEHDASGKTLYRENIPQVSSTLGYFWTEALAVSDGAYCGMSGSDMFVNDSGVCVVSNYGGQAAEHMPEGESGIIYAVRRTIAERARTPYEGVLTAARMVRDYGYLQARIYEIANADEAWIFQVAGGNYFAAKKLGDDEVALVANCLTIRNIDFSNADEIEGGIMSNGTWLWSKGLVENAIEKGWYKPADPNDKTYKDFDFAYCYQAHGTEFFYGWNAPFHMTRLKHAISMVTEKEWTADNGAVQPNHPEQGIPFTVRPAHKVSKDTMKSVLRSHYEGTADDPKEHREMAAGGNPHDIPLIRRICAQTTDTSMIYEAGETPELSTVWLSTGRPCELPYFPLHPTAAKELPQKLQMADDPAAAMAEHFKRKTDIGAWDGNSAWWNMRDLQNRLDLLYCDAAEAHTKWLSSKDSKLDAENDAAMQNAKGLSDEDRQKYFAAWDDRVFGELYTELMKERDSMPAVQIEPVSRTLSKSDHDGFFTIKFRLDGGRTPDLETLRFGLGTTDSDALSHDSPIPWQRAEHTEREYVWYTASFPARFLAAENYAVLPGFNEYYLCGRDVEDRPFCGMIVVSVTE